MHVVLARYCYRKSSFRPSVCPSVCEPAISLKRGKIGPRLLLMTIRKSYYALLIGAKINDLGWPWRAITHCVSKHVRLWEPTTKISMKIDPYCRRKCSQMTLDSGNYKVYADIHSGSHDLCKFSWFYACAPILRIQETACRSRFQFRVFVYDS